MRGRDKARALVSAGLRLVPDALVQPLRGRAPLPILEILRHRGVRSGEVFTLPDNPGLRFVGDDSLVLQRVYWMGERGYEPHVVRWWRECCRSAHAALEVGANVGYYTVQGAIANPGLAYLAVEPHPTNAGILRRNVAANGLEEVKMLEAAVVADQPPRPVQLTIPRVDHFAAPAGGFVSGGELTHAAGSTVTVEAVAATEVFAGRDLVKIDAEGSEHAILSAVRDHLLDRRPTVFVEVLDGASLLRTLLHDLCRGPYALLVPTSGGLRRLDADALRDVSFERRFATRDVILTADERLLAVSRAAY